MQFGETLGLPTQSNGVPLSTSSTIQLLLIQSNSGSFSAVLSVYNTNKTERLVVPWAAVLHDHHGTEWVYEQAEDNVFRRRRVLVDYTVPRPDGDLAVLAGSLPEGMLVVVDGTAELFGTEFGVGH